MATSSIGCGARLFIDHTKMDIMSSSFCTEAREERHFCVKEEGLTFRHYSVTQPQ